MTPQPLPSSAPPPSHFHFQTPLKHHRIQDIKDLSEIDDWMDGMSPPLHPPPPFAAGVWVMEPSVDGGARPSEELFSVSCHSNENTAPPTPTPPAGIFIHHLCLWSKYAEEELAVLLLLHPLLWSRAFADAIKLAPGNWI